MKNKDLIGSLVCSGCQKTTTLFYAIDVWAIKNKKSYCL